MNNEKISPKDLVGFHANMNFEDYVKIDAINQSSLKKIINESPFKFWWYNNYGQEDKTDFKVGRLAHTCILEPKKLEENYFKLPETIKDFREAGYFDFLTTEDIESIESAKRPTATNAYKKMVEIVDKKNDKKPIKSKDWKILMGMKNAVERNSKMKNISDRYVTELVAVWYDEENECYCKCMMDGINNNGIIVDLKSTKYAGLPFFVYDVKRYGYDFQAAFYTRGAKKSFQQNSESLIDILKENGANENQIYNFKIRLYVIVAVEKSVPQEIAIHSCSMDGSVISSGDIKLDRAFKKYRECKKNNNFHTYRDFDDSEIINLDKHYEKLLKR